MMKLGIIVLIAIITTTLVFVLGVSTILLMLSKNRNTTENVVADSSYSPLFILVDQSNLSEYLILV